jgi:hypothetical protein
MNNLLEFLFRISILVILVTVITTAAYFLNGGTTKVGLSDWMVYASFFTLTAGTFCGIFRVGYKGDIAEEAAIAEMGMFERLLKVFFKVGSFGWGLALAGVLCFLVGVLVDVLF